MGVSIDVVIQAAVPDAIKALKEKKAWFKEQPRPTPVKQAQVGHTYDESTLSILLEAMFLFVVMVLGRTNSMT